MIEFVVMSQVRTDDPDLTEAKLALLTSSAEAALSVRSAVSRGLPGSVTRLIAVMPVEYARMLMMLHEAVGRELGGEAFGRPPADYVAPGDKR